MTTRSGLPIRPLYPVEGEVADSFSPPGRMVGMNSIQVEPTVHQEEGTNQGFSQSPVLTVDEMRSHIVEEVGIQLNECFTEMRDMMLTEFKALLQQPSSALPSRNAIASMEQSTNPNDNSNNQKAYGTPGGTQTIPFLKPKPYDGTVDWDSYLTQFELIAVRNGWDNVTKAAVLGAALCGPALTLLSELQHPIRVQKPNEDIRTYHREMQELGRKAWPQAKGSMDSVIVTHFMNGLRDIRIRERVLTAWPETMTAALTLALRMEAVSRLAPPKTASIGYETALDIARRGARVVMACRNTETAAKAREEIAEKTKNSNVVVKKLDLSSLKSVREFAADINKNESRLDVLVHNAGMANTFEKKVTEDGLEITMATNMYGPFLLTHLLIDLLKKSKPSRIVIVASDLYKLANLDLENPNPINSLPAYLYYVSKRGNILWARELSRRLEGSGVTANFLHPGMIDSGIWRNVPFPLNLPLKVIVKVFFKTPEKGAQTTVHLAVSDELDDVNGKYFMDCR
ncbi:hypothetical protein GE061_015009, partial [Apolygus lucorum]